MLRVFVLSLILPLNIVADAFLSSPKLSLNSQGERVIEFKIQSARISDEDIILKEYKSNELLNQENISYTLLEDFSTYKTYSIVLNNSYDGNYFNFKLVIEDQISKDIFTGFKAYIIIAGVPTFAAKLVINVVSILGVFLPK